MNLTLLDWAIVAIAFLLVTIIGLYTSRYNRSVADFLSANRCAGRYLLTAATSMSSMSVVGITATFEMFYQAGFGALWWGFMTIPLGLFINLSGWVAYRFRETRALTMAQFFEIRYSRNFRIFSGALCFFSGLLNYAIFPGITARVLIYFCGIPETVGVFGLAVSTFPLVMFVILFLGVFLAIAGGQIALMVTDFLQGQFANIVLVVVMIILFVKFGWGNIADGLQTAKAGKSMIDPFQQAEIPDFNFWYFVILAFLSFYGHMSWQGSQGYFSSAKSPHEAKMANILASLRGNLSQGVLLVFIPICAFVLLNSPDYTEQAATVKSAIDAIPDAQMQKQLTTHLALVNIIPPGVLGMFAVLLIAAAVSTDDTYLHSWGSILVQDVLTPLRKKPLTARQHLFWLRLSIVGVAVFSFLFCLFFKLHDYIFMYMILTGVIFTGGAGSAIIGGLYWKRGTTAGAWAGMITGSGLSVTGILLQNYWQNLAPLIGLHVEFPLNGIHISFIAALMAFIAYVVVSLLTSKTPFNMDKMLHRGKYAIQGEHEIAKPKPNFLMKIIGMGKEFTLGDKIIYIMTFLWGNLWFIIFVAVTIIALSVGLNIFFWVNWWHFIAIFTVVVGVLITIWYTTGGVKDLIDLFHTLKTTRRIEQDDGTVVKHQNLADDVFEDDTGA